MGREFLELFEEWAETYDHTVTGADPEYEAVFANYDMILQQVTENCGNSVLEFGVGTGNLSEKLLQEGKQVIGIEPSAAMRAITKQKLPDLSVMDGDFLHYPPVMESVDTITSTYAFHHLTDKEKSEAIFKFKENFPSCERIVFADTMFRSELHKEEVVNEAKNNGYFVLAEDLEREYYPTLEVIEAIFKAHHFNVELKQLNKFVWLVIAER